MNRPVAYEPEVLREHIDRRDRDTAPYFAGRAFEIERFERALRSVRNRQHNDTAAEFLIYQGAPGCGKTSLAKHLDDTHPDALFIQVAMDHLRSSATFGEKIETEAVAAAKLGRRGALLVLRAAGERMKMKDAANGLAANISSAAAKNAHVVLHLDEAQTVGADQQPILMQLHTAGTITPCVFLMTGLSHTKDTVGQLEGLSRMASDATVDVGAMTNDECAESIWMMLDAAGVRGDIGRVSELLAPVAMGWPQHLKGVQDALAKQVEREGGDVDRVDHRTIRNEAARFRNQYYEGRLDGSALTQRPSFTYQLIAKIHESDAKDRVDLFDVCAEELERSGLAEHPGFDANARDLTTALVEKGVVTITRDRGCAVTIPSMAAWAASMITDNPPSARPTGRRRPTAGQRSRLH